MRRDEFLVIGNKGQAIASTNYYDTEPASRGMYYLSWNAGTGRLLVPDSQKATVREMRSATYVIVSSGPWEERGGVPAFELVFEDHSDTPFVITIALTDSDRLLAVTDQGGGFYIAVWTRGGLKLRLPGRYRQVAQLPCMEEWPNGR